MQCGQKLNSNREYLTGMKWLDTATIQNNGRKSAEVDQRISELIDNAISGINVNRLRVA